MTTPSRVDLPTIEADSKPFWDAAREHRFLIARCNACGRAHHYPRPFCPFCWSDDVHWEDASGRATLYTYSTVYVNDLYPFRDKLPYLAAVVDLEEGPRVMTRLVGVRDDELSIDMQLVVDYENLNDQLVAPVFRPA
ncbi:MAG: hypothetical protein JWN96_955 [Mycobacterium sp.]|jgi:uncharacterized OB-fold protein|nr:hypothetical protein [Mycobacterium sp.]